MSRTCGKLNNRALQIATPYSTGPHQSEYCRQPMHQLVKVNFLSQGACLRAAMDERPACHSLPTATSPVNTYRGHDDVAPCALALCCKHNVCFLRPVSHHYEALHASLCVCGYSDTVTFTWYIGPVPRVIVCVCCSHVVHQGSNEQSAGFCVMSQGSMTHTMHVLVEGFRTAGRSTWVVLCSQSEPLDTEQ